MPFPINMTLNPDIARENADFQCLVDMELREISTCGFVWQQDIIDFQKSLSSILAFYPEKISVGISEDECAFIYFEKDGKVIYFDLFFETQQKMEASVTVFENKVSKVSFTDYLENSICRLNRELDKPRNPIGYIKPQNH